MPAPPPDVFPRRHPYALIPLLFGARVQLPGYRSGVEELKVEPCGSMWHGPPLGKYDLLAKVLLVSKWFQSQWLSCTFDVTKEKLEQGGIWRRGENLLWTQTMFPLRENKRQPPPVMSQLLPLYTDNTKGLKRTLWEKNKTQKTKKQPRGQISLNTIQFKH